MKMRVNDKKVTYSDKISKSKKMRPRQKLVANRNDRENDPVNLQTEDIKIINKHLNRELEIKTQELTSTNARLSMLKTQLQHREHAFLDLNNKYERLKEAVGNQDAEELKISISKLKRYQELTNKNKNGTRVLNDVEVTKSESISLMDLVKTLEVSNHYNKQSFEKEVEHHKLLEAELRKAESTVASLTKENIKLSYEMDWNKTRLIGLSYKQEELLRKNASLQEYSDTLREKYEALLLQQKKKKRWRGPENVEGEKKIKVEETTYRNVCEKKISEVNNAKANYEPEKEQSENDSGLCKVKKFFENDYDEKEKTTELEEKLDRMMAEITCLQREKDNFEKRLRCSEENYGKLKASFDELSLLHSNLLDFRNKEQMKINERIICLNERLDLLGKRYIERYEGERLPLMKMVPLQKDFQEKNKSLFSIHGEEIATEA